MRIRLFLTGIALGICGVVSAAAADLYLAGDSTLAPRKPTDNKASWGEWLQPHLAEGTKLCDCAVGGTSTKSFRAKFWDKKVVPNLKSGDWVIIQFGINDPHHTGKQYLEKGDIDRFCPVDEYCVNLKKFIEDVRAKNAKPLLCTPISSRGIFTKDGKVMEKKRDKRWEYAEAMRKVAQETQTPLVDMLVLTEEIVKTAGVEASKEFFNCKFDKKDNTHPTKEGAAKFGEAFLKEIKKQKLPITEIFK